GIGNGGLAPTEQSIFADTFPPEKRAQAVALYGLTVVTAPAVGPTLGGWLTDTGFLALVLSDQPSGRAAGPVPCLDGHRRARGIEAGPAAPARRRPARGLHRLRPDRTRLRRAADTAGPLRAR